jgi:hypothetical protein
MATVATISAAAASDSECFDSRREAGNSRHQVIRTGSRAQNQPQALSTGLSRDFRCPDRSPFSSGIEPRGHLGPPRHLSGSLDPNAYVGRREPQKRKNYHIENACT